MSGLHVLIVDDSVLARKFLKETLAGCPEIGKVTIAPDGQIALGKIGLDRPDIVILDIEMPVLDGLATLARIRLVDRDLPVIMLSAAEGRGADLVLESLASGASDFVTKPSRLTSVEETTALVRAALIPRILQFCRPKRAAPATPAPAAPAVREPAAKPPFVVLSPRFRIDAIVIGVSTGGPNALEVVLGNLPEDLAPPIFIVQHMPAYFTKLLAERLGEKSRLPMAEALRGQAARRGGFLAPGDYHMTIRRGDAATLIDLNQNPLENSCRPAADVLFRSAAKAFGRNLLAVVMTGMGQDGLAGCREIKAAGGTVIAQDEASSVVWGMPGSVVKAGLADAVLPLDEIASAIVRLVRGERTLSPRDAGARPDILR